MPSLDRAKTPDVEVDVTDVSDAADADVIDVVDVDDVVDVVDVDDVVDAAVVDAGCSSDAMCVGNAAGGVCDVTTGRCVECVASRDTCPADRHCDATSSRCLPGCRADEGCAGSDGGASLRCDTATRTCVECVTDDHCPAGRLCSGQRCVSGCSATRACPSGQSCCSGACIDVAVNVAHCGACDRRCDVANGAPACSAGACGVGTCTAPFADCNRTASDGCEANTQTSLSHCGACGNACPSRANAASTCAAGACGSRCNDGFADCDGDVTNGCEVDTRSSVAHCGRCGAACSAAGGTASCAAGACSITCSITQGNCDGDVTNGCEVDTRSSVAHCGACGRACATGERCVFGLCVPPTPTSCAALLRRAPTTADGSYTIAPVGGSELTAYCDMSTGRGYTFVTGRTAAANPTDILAACPAGTAAFEVRSEAHAAALRRQVRRLSSSGAWYWANHFSGPMSTCPTVAARTGWLRSATDWVDAVIRPEFLAPLDIHENCNLDGMFDPVPINDRDGFANRDCAAPRTVLYNSRERSRTGTVICSVNDVPACAAGYDDCDGIAANGCEVRVATDAANCGRCGRACAAGLTCGAGACVGTVGGGVFTPDPPAVPTGTPAVMATSIRGPQGLVIARDGMVYVSALTAGTIVRIDPAVTPGIVTTWATGFSEPAQLAFDAAGNILVAERSGNRLTRVVMNADGTSGARNTVATGFSGPWGVTVETSGDYLVSNEFGATVDRVAAASGAVTRGVISGYNGPLDMRFDLRGRLIVGQYFGTGLGNGNLVHRYDATLRLERSSMGFSGPIGIALDSAGNAYVANWDGGATGAGRILRVDDAGTVSVFYRGLNGPHAIAFDARGGLWIADYATDRVLRLGGT